MKTRPRGIRVAGHVLALVLFAAGTHGCDNVTDPELLRAAVTVLRGSPSAYLAAAHAEATEDGVLVRGQVVACALETAAARALSYGATVKLELIFRDANAFCFTEHRLEYLAVVEGVPRGEYRLVVTVRHRGQNAVLDTTVTP